jgi:hypothetical protein
MKKLISILMILLSFTAFGSQSECEDMTYTKEWIDYDSDWNDSCTHFIKAAMKADGCNVDKLYLSPIRMTEMISGSELMCIYKGKAGIYQVMASQMAEPHRAVVLFSRWD